MKFNIHNKDTMTEREKQIADYYKRVGAEHTETSKETLIKFDDMEQRFLNSQLECKKTNIIPIMEELKKVSEKITSLELKITKEIAELPLKLDKRYASKNVERGFYAMIGAVSLAILYALLEHLGI